MSKIGKRKNMEQEEEKRREKLVGKILEINM